MDCRLLRMATSKVWVAAVLLCCVVPLGSQAPSQPVSSPPSAPPGPTGEYTISANVDLVLLDVSVRDSDGGFVSGLPKDAFTIVEDGRAQTITQFANQDIPVTMGLVVDNSGSMRPKKPEVVTAALILLQASNPQDEVFVVNFNDRVRRGLPDIVPFSDDIKMLRAALAKTDPAGRTALYDAVLAGLHHLDMGRRDKKTLVVVSDGGDNISTHTFKETLDAVLQSRATIYTVGVYDEDDHDKNPDVLRKLARMSGGVCYLPKQLNEVEDICRQIAKDIRARYTIGYVPQSLDKSGIRHLKVDVHSADHKKLIARTRTSYAVSNQVQTTDRKK
jgi:Ca-activated chloride channel homolog